jgi:hypothetical protein
MINRVEYVAKVHDVMYQVSNHKQMTLPLALIDRGANGGVVGSDTRLIDKSLRSVHTPTNPDLDERVRDILSHIFGEAHADGTGELDKLIASVMKQAASQHREWSQPKAQDVPAADLRKMLSHHQGRDKASVMINGVEYVAKVHDVMYQVSNHKQTMLPLALIDRGANGGVAGSDTWLIDKSLRSVHIQGIDDHMIKDVPIGTVGAVVNTQHGEVIAIMHQYAYTGKGGTIHSSSQLEWCGNDINDHSIKIDGGRQRLTTPDGYVISIDVRHGLPYITMRPFTDEEFEELPHVLWTSEDDWDPTSLDSVISDDPNWYEAEPSPPLPNRMYDEYGEFRGCVLINQHEWQVHYFDALDTKITMTNFMTPWSNLQMTQTVSSTSSSTVLIVLVTFATMKQ